MRPDLILRTEAAELCLDRSGGRITAYRVSHAGRPFELLQPADISGSDGAASHSSGSFPLVPYSNRIANGRFRFCDRVYRVPLNFGAHPHSIHGVGWQSVWQVDSQTPGTAVLTLDHDGEGWPFPFHAEQRLKLEGATLIQELLVTNTGTLDMPVGLGVHPYFPRHQGATLRADVSHVWMTDATCLPTERTPCPDAWQLSNRVDIADILCDNQFEHWTGGARIEWPEDGVALDMEASQDLDRLVVYVPDGKDFFCVEPVSHMTDAFNKTANGMSEAQTGMRVLTPGETWSVEVRFKPDVL